MEEGTKLKKEKRAKADTQIVGSGFDRAAMSIMPCPAK